MTEPFTSCPTWPLGGGKFQGCVGGAVFPVTQEEYVEPMRERRVYDTIARHHASHPVEREDGVVFGSIREAMEVTGIEGTGAIASSIRRGGTCGGYRWRYVGQDWNVSVSPTDNAAIGIRCIETGEDFRSVTRCARSIGKSRTAVRNAVRNGTAIDGLHYRRA